MNFLLNNWQSILLGIGAIGFIGNIVAHKKWSELRTAAYKFIRVAEMAVGENKRGADKFELVFASIYSLVIPPWMRLFITEPMVKRMLQVWFEDVKDYLDDGILNKSTSVMGQQEKGQEESQQDA